VLRTTHRSLPAVLTALVLAAPGAALLALPAAAASGTTAAALDGACTDADGVTVVVDSTALGGAIEAGCAPEAGVTGTEALLAAGFTEARDPSGFLCAVDGLPDPCPTEFTGEYWSYWYAEPGDGTWTAYQEGSDTAVVAAGAVEGWRYGDGSEGPDVALPLVVDEAAATADGSDDEGTTEETGTAGAEEAGAGTADDDAAGPPTALLAGIGLLGVLAVAAAVVARRRSAQGADGSDRASDHAGTPAS
jgi:hypothetical protein